MSRPLDIQTPLGAKALLLTQFSGSEHLSRVSEFHVQLKSKKPDILGEQMLGQNVTVRLELVGASREGRYFNGYVTRWGGVTEIVDSVVGQNDTKAYLYEATVHPWLWFLTRQANSRIFQDKTVPEILKAVFTAHGGLASFEDKTTRTYPRWTYCCQYRETDFNFVCRLMEQEGIYYYFRHENGKHTLVLADSSAHHTPNKGFEKLRFDQEDRPDLEAISHWKSNYEIQPGKYVVDDYNPTTPHTAMRSHAEQKRKHPYDAFEFFDYPAEFDTADEGRQYARTRLDELQAQYHTFDGGGTVRGFQAGSVFELERHPVQAHNAKHLIVGVNYSGTCNSDSSGGTAFSFSSSIQAIPANQQYRPPRVTPKPLIQGPQTATVVGPSGEEIYTDDDKHMGCVKVQFRWDRYGKADQNSSCWIRVATPWAGNGYGALAIPRIGQEVVVEFLEGDPDWPLIVGSVYNATNEPPYKLPAEKTRWGLKSRSSKGGGASNFNELRFEDKRGDEEVYLRAEKDHNLYIKHDRKEKILNESHLDVAKDVLGKFGADVHADIKGDDITEVGGGVHLKVGQDWQGKMGTRMAVDAGQEIHLKAGATVVIEAASQLSLKVGGNFITIDSSGVYIKGTMVNVNSGGAAGSGSGSSPKAPKNAEKAVDSVGGKDKPITQKAAALMAARAASTPFCEICNA
jgi:type VI secretion system secreted protein VgrG